LKHCNAPGQRKDSCGKTTAYKPNLKTDLPLPAFLGGRGGASAVGEVGESVLAEAKI